MKQHIIHLMTIVFGFAVLTLSSSYSNAQGKNESYVKKHIKVPTLHPRSEDVLTLDGIIKAYYEIISGPAGQARDWGRDRTLYIPGVKFVSTNAQNGKPIAKIVDHQQYVDEANEVLVKKGFFENEIRRVVRTFGNITHVFSSYESRYTLDGPVMARGINSIELFNDGKRWWIASAIWDVERPDNPIPSDMLH